MLQQIVNWDGACSQAMVVDDGVEMSEAVREIASEPNGRTKILARALQSVATSAQGLSDRAPMQKAIRESAC